MKRRPFLAAVALGWAAGCSRPRLTLPGPSRESTETAWPAYAFDAANTATTAARGPRAPVRERWQSHSVRGVATTPAVIGGTVYFGAADRSIHAVDRVTGEPVWEVATDGSVVSSPAVVDGVVYAGSTDEHLYAVDSATGDRRWRIETSSRLVTAVTVADGVVLCAGRGNDVSVDYGAVYARDAATGDERWTYRTRSWVTNTPAVADDRCFVTDRDGRVHAVGLDDGQRRWESRGDLRVSQASPPVVVEGTPSVVLRGGGRVHAVVIDTGEVQWTTALDGPALSGTLAVRDGTAFVASEPAHPCPDCRRRTLLVTALDVETGTVEWQVRRLDSSPRAGVSADRDTLYVVDDVGVLALATEDGHERWRSSLPAASVQPPSVVDDALFVGCDDGRVRALETGSAG